MSCPICSQKRALHTCNACLNSVCSGCFDKFLQSHGDSLSPRKALFAAIEHPCMFDLNHTIGFHQVRSTWKTAMERNMTLRLEAFFAEDDLELMKSVRKQQRAVIALINEKVLPSLQPVTPAQLVGLKNTLAENVDQLTDMLNQLKLTLSEEPCTFATCKGKVRNGICEECFFFKCETCTLVHPFTEGCPRDQLESKQLIDSDCRACPGCQAPIHRIDGCPQMLCTVCRTRFDFNTGKEIGAGVNFHNPHLNDPDMRASIRIDFQDVLVNLSLRERETKACFLRQGLDLLIYLTDRGIEASLNNFRVCLIGETFAKSTLLKKFPQKIRKLLHARDALREVLLPVLQEQTTKFTDANHDVMLRTLKKLGHQHNVRLVTHLNFYRKETFVF